MTSYVARERRLQPVGDLTACQWLAGEEREEADLHCAQQIGIRSAA